MTIYNLFDSHSGDLIVKTHSQSEFQSLVSQRKNGDPNILILESKTAKEVNSDYSCDTFGNEVFDFFVYQMGKSSDPLSRETNTNDEWQSVETLGEVLIRRIKQLISSIRKQQALELFFKHLTQIEFEKIKERGMTVRSCLHKFKDFLSQELPNGIESTIEQLRRTKWFPMDNTNTDSQSLLDFLNRTSTTINEKGLIEQYSELKKSLSYLENYLCIIDSVSKTFKEKLDSIQICIGHFEEGDGFLDELQQLMDAVDGILTHYNTTKQNASSIEQSSNDTFDSAADSIALTNEEIELKKDLEKHYPKIKDLEDSFASFLTQNSKNDSDLLKFLGEWKLRITKAIEYNEFIIKRRESQQIMDNLACALRLPFFYQQIKKEFVRRSYFYKKFEEMTNIFYEELKGLIANELNEREKFQDMHNNIIDNINDNIKKQILTLSDEMDVGNESNHIELPPLSHFLFLPRGKISNSEALVNSILEEHEWVEIGHDDLKSPSLELSIRIEDKKQATFDVFGSASVIFDSNLEKLKRLNDAHKLTVLSETVQCNSAQSITSSVMNNNSIDSIIQTTFNSNSNVDTDPRDMKHIEEPLKQAVPLAEKSSTLTKEKDELRNKLGNNHVNQIEYANVQHSANELYNSRHLIEHSRDHITNLEQQISQQENQLVELRNKVSRLEAENISLSNESSTLYSEKSHLNEKLEILKNQVRDLRVLVLEKISQAEKLDLKTAQDKIKQLQAIIQQAGKQLDENKKKFELCNKVIYDLQAISPNLIYSNERYQRDVAQIKENSSNPKNDQNIKQAMLLTENIWSIVDKLFNICNPLNPLFSSQSEYIRKCNDQIIRLLLEERDRTLKGTEEKEQNNLQKAKENDTMKISTNNFKFGDLMLFINYESDIFEAYTIEQKRYFLSPDCIYVLKDKWGHSYGRRDKFVGYALYFEEVKNDVLNIGVRPPYVIVTCGNIL